MGPAAAREDPSQHVAGLREALQLNPRDIDALLLLGEGLAAQGKEAEATEVFKTAAASHPPFMAQRKTINQALGRK